MALKVNVTRDLDVTIMELAGMVTLGEGSVTYREAIRQALWNGDRKFAVDYGNISYQDSSGNGELVASFTRVANSGGELVLFDLTKRIQDMFQVTRLTKCFRIYDSRASALAYFGSTRKTETKVSEFRFLDVSVLVMEGSLREGSGPSRVLSSTQAALDSGAESVVLLCRQLLDLDENGAESVIKAWRHVKARGGELVLAGMEERLQPALAKVATLDEIPAYKTIDDALLTLNLEVTQKGGRFQVIRAG